ncbi:MAG: leucine--tRNA ligase [Bacteroidetes bacterium]|nr:leucine--tRNA ligase [Bacteroidota bacterium]
MQYNFQDIESFATSKWEASDVYKIGNNPDKPKFYVLDMFPYPSGAGLHVGHPLGYIASDIYSRYKRLSGFNVLHPMGFDAFGLPAEQYAIQTGKHPADTTRENIETYKKQLSRIGFSYDWSREVSTADPSYYKWTQWIFLQLFDSWFDNAQQKARRIDELISAFSDGGNDTVDAAGGEGHAVFNAEQWNAMSGKEQSAVLMDYRLAYQSEAWVNWCEALGTVLANDEVKDGLSERGGHPVERKRMTQWFLRITAYAERLLDGLDKLSWSDSMKEMQRNWIGKSFGATMIFKTADGEHDIEVFTTRPDTTFGVTFMVLAPEHELIGALTTPEQAGEIENYIKYVKSRSEIERQQEKSVTGAFTGSYAINPFNGDKVPVYISEYVLAGYGTGAIMAVPSDDDRDEAFAHKFGIDIIEVIDKSKYPQATKADKLGIVINSGFMNGMEVPGAIEASIDKIEELGIGSRKTNFRMRDAGFSRQRYWGEPFPVYMEDGIVKTVPETDLPVVLPEMSEFKPAGGGKGPLFNASDWVEELGPGKVRETDTMPGYAGSSWYFLRYMDPHNTDALVGKEAVDYWQDIDLYIGGTEHAVGHLLYSRFWHKFFNDNGWVPTEEPFKKLVNQGMIQGRSLIMPDGAINNFPSGLRVPLNYTDPGDRIYKDRLSALISEDNRFESININSDIVSWKSDGKGDYIELMPEVEKMSKRYHNVINPDDIINQHGADCFRMFEMFLGPIEHAKPWDTQSIGGVSKFLQKLWRLFNFDEDYNPAFSGQPASKDDLKSLHKAIKKVREDIERLSFNTAVSAFMVLVNDLGRNKQQSKEIMEQLVIVLSPFAPFTCEYLWSRLGHETCLLQEATYPAFNESYLVEAMKTYPVSINGKVRTKLDFTTDADKASIEAGVLANDVVQKWLDGNTPKKVIVVPGRIVNVVT